MTDSAVVATMSDALSREDPEAALRELSLASAVQASTMAVELYDELQSSTSSFRPSIPQSLKLSDQHPVQQAAACTDSIWNSLSKIATGGSKASLEIRQLEGEKAALEQEAVAIQTALMLRQASQKAAAATLQAKQPDLVGATQALRPWLLWKQEAVASQDQATRAKRAAAYAGDYALQQLDRAYQHVQDILLKVYQEAVRAGNLQVVGQLTPLLGNMQLEETAVKLYMQFVKQSVWPTHLQEASRKTKEKPLYVRMAAVYNVTVGVLRHHLPLVSHCLYKATGDVALVQLAHEQCTAAVLPLWQDYRRQKKWSTVSRKASQIATVLQDRYTAGMEDDVDDDAGFSQQIGSLSEVDTSLEEAALCVQHAEAYLRFLAHSCDQVGLARKMRHDQDAQRRLQEKRQRQSEWDSSEQAGKEEMEDDEEEKEEDYQPVEILPISTTLHQTVAEVGGQYVAVEHCLLLASLQRAFAAPETEDHYYRPLSAGADSSTTIAQQTSMVDACWYAARRSTQRAFATGHTGTASAMANFVADTLAQVVTEVLRQRAEDLGVAHLKPGEGLLVGSAGIFNNASNLIRAGQKTVGGAEEVLRKQKVQEHIGQACAVINDMEVAVHHTQNLEKFLSESIGKGFAPGTHETDALVMCVKSFSMVTDGLKGASDATIESLESILRPRIRSIVGEAVGSEGSTTAFMPMGAKSDDRTTIRMHYNLDEDTYNLVQLSEGYMARLSALLDELMGPLRQYLAPRLWDTLWLHVIGTASKRLESFVRKCPFTALGGLAFDSDMREWLSYTRNVLLSGDSKVSNQTVLQACPSLSRLVQMARLINIDDLEDVMDLMAASKRKGQWDLKEEDAQSFLSQRVDFDASRVQELLRIPED
jgi:hypothetical protein